MGGTKFIFCIQTKSQQEPELFASLLKHLLLPRFAQFGRPRQRQLFNMEPCQNSQFTLLELPEDDEQSCALPNSWLFSKPSASSAQTFCCECERTDLKTWKCLQCDDSFCDTCWAKQRPHRVRAPPLASIMRLWIFESFPQITTPQVNLTDTWSGSPERLASMIDLTKKSMKRWSKDSNRPLAILPPKNNLHDTSMTSIQPGLGCLRRQPRACPYIITLVLSTSCKIVDRESTMIGSLNLCLSWVRLVGVFSHVRPFQLSQGQRLTL